MNERESRFSPATKATAGLIAIAAGMQFIVKSCETSPAPANVAATTTAEQVDNCGNKLATIQDLGNHSPRATAMTNDKPCTKLYDYETNEQLYDIYNGTVFAACQIEGRNDAIGFSISRGGMGTTEGYLITVPGLIDQIYTKLEEC